VWHGFIADENALEPEGLRILPMPLLLPAIGLLIGAVLGLTGAGGSVLAVPLLLLLLKLDPASATGLALGVVAASSGYGAIQRIRQQEVLWIPAALFGISGGLFAPPGRLLASYLPPVWLLGSFTLLSLVIATRMFMQSIQHPEQARVVRAEAGDGAAEPLLCKLSETGRFDWRVRCMAGLVGGGVITGLLSGLFGVGGGFLIVPFLNQLNGVSMRHAVATSLVIIAAIASSGFVAHISIHAVNWAQLLQLAAGGIAGMVLGSILARWLVGARLQQVFAVVIIVMATLVWFR
jgi:uncharacterized membrane protein YfcA